MDPRIWSYRQWRRADNIETVRSLNGLTVDKTLQLSLSAGLFSFLGIDPHLRSHFTAHFTDLTVVRVKDIALLAGPAGEPHIVEALKAGGITVTSDSDAGLAARTLGFDQSKLSGQMANDRSRSFSIDGRDLFVAIRVATREPIEGPEHEFKLEATGPSSGNIRISEYELAIANIGCVKQGISGCTGPTAVSLAKATSPSVAPTSVLFDATGSADLSLPMPLSDGGSGLYTKLAVRLIPSCRRAKASGCARQDRAIVRYLGERVQALSNPEARAWR